MKTPSHAIINLAILGKPQLPQANLIIVIGGILPDIPIFLFYFWAKYIARLPAATIWSKAYYEPFVQNIVALFHSIPLAVIGLLIAYYFGWQSVQILFTSIVLHSLGDLPVHYDDAHRHFFPFSNYRFISPFSYWEKSNAIAFDFYIPNDESVRTKDLFNINNLRNIDWLENQIGYDLFSNIPTAEQAVIESRSIADIKQWINNNRA